jgi:secreted trypsin-like serine protease
MSRTFNFSMIVKSFLAVIVTISLLATGATTASGTTTPAPTVQVSPSSGSTQGGDTVTVSGLVVRAASSVSVGGVTAGDVVFAAGQSSVTFTTPARSAGAADIVIQNAGEDLTLSGAFTYVADSPPAAEEATVDTISPNRGVASGGDPITITGAGLQHVQAVFFGTNPATGMQISQDSTTLTAVSPSGEPGAVNITLMVDGQLVVTQLEYTYEPQQIRPNIVNGVTAAISDAPWQVQVTPVYGSSTFLCGGSLIAADWVVTAAHCVDGTPASVTVRAGNATTNAGATKTVSNIYLHPSYVDDNTFKNDIALLKLSSAYTLTPGSIEVILLPTTERKSATEWPANGATALITGWGTTSTLGPISNVLMKANVNVLGSPTTATCGSYGGAYQSSIMLCAQGGSAPNYTDACSGDSGGPLAVPTGLGSSLHYLAGVTSFGSTDGCANASYPGVWTRTTAFVDWIVPGRAASLIAVPGDQQMTITATPPASLPQRPITNWALMRSNSDMNGFTGIAAGVYNPSSPPVSFTDTGLTNGNSYRYMFIYMNEVNFSTSSNFNAAFSNTAMVGPPVSPTVGFVVGGNNMVYAEYSAARGDSYNLRVYTALTGGTHITGSGLFPDSFFVNPRQLLGPSVSLANGTVHYLEVTARNAAGETTSVSRTPFTPTTSVGSGTPTIEGLSTNGSDKSWQLYASTSAGAYRTAYYYSFLSADPTDYSWQLSSGSGNPDPLSMTDTYMQRASVITNGVTYHVSGVIISNTGISAWSNRLPVTPRATPGFSFLTNSGPLPFSVDLTWTVPTAYDGTAMTITGYRIDYTNDAGFTWQTTVANTGNSDRTRTVRGLDPTKSYIFRVAGIVAAGLGAWSNGSGSITPTKNPQTVTWTPTNTSVTGTSGTITPNSNATSNGDGALSYGVSSAGTTGCSVNSSTGVVTFAATGTCNVAASAAATSTYEAGSATITFTISPPTPAPSPGGGGGGGSSEPAAPAVPVLIPITTPVQGPVSAPLRVPPVPSSVLTNPAGVTAQQVSALSPEQIGTIPAATFGALPPAAFKALSPAQVSELSTAQVAAIRPARAAVITPAAVAALSTTQLTAMRPKSVGSLNPTALRLLSAEQVASLTTRSVRFLQPDQVAKLRPTQVTDLAERQVAALRPSSLKVMPASTFKAFSVIQLEALTNKQKKFLTTKQLSQLSPAQRQAIG